MAKVHYSAVLSNPIDVVWDKIKDFNDDRWSGDVTKSKSENNQSGSTVGTIRIHEFNDKVARSDLKAYSALEHSFTYGFVGESPLPIENYVSTIRLTPITEDTTTFMEWSATFDCKEAERERLTLQLYQSYQRWVKALRTNLDK
ncbi:MAG TPA: SRPBCC family protein [Candidatus Saccharimonadales bacterium]|nr:SRPBCC family protein [Candidatus Saccharimonadales bacterium]